MEEKIMETVAEEVITEAPKTKVGLIVVGVAAGAAITYIAVKKIRKGKKVKLEVIRPEEDSESNEN